MIISSSPNKQNVCWAAGFLPWSWQSTQQSRWHKFICVHLIENRGSKKRTFAFESLKWPPHHLSVKLLRVLLHLPGQCVTVTLPPPGMNTSLHPAGTCTLQQMDTIYKSIFSSGTKPINNPRLYSRAARGTTRASNRDRRWRHPADPKQRRLHFCSGGAGWTPINRCRAGSARQGLRGLHH